MEEAEAQRLIDEALIALGQVTAAYRRAEARYRQQRDAVHEAIVKAFEVGAKPSDIERVSPYDRNHNARIRDAAGIPPTRPATVKSIKEQ